MNGEKIFPPKPIDTTGKRRPRAPSHDSLLRRGMKYVRSIHWKELAGLLLMLVCIGMGTVRMLWGGN